MSAPTFLRNLPAGSSFIYLPKEQMFGLSSSKDATSRLLSQTWYTVSPVLEMICDSHLITFLA